jgi:hypothetical protein
MTNKTNPGTSGASPKREAHPPGNTGKDPADWISGGEPMTGTQASYLKTLSEEAYEFDAFDPALTKAEASRRINALKAKLSRLVEPPHTQ